MSGRWTKKRKRLTGEMEKKREKWHLGKLGNND